MAVARKKTAQNVDTLNDVAVNNLEVRTVRQATALKVCRRWF